MSVTSGMGPINLRTLVVGTKQDPIVTGWGAQAWNGGGAWGHNLDQKLI